MSATVFSKSAERSKSHKTQSLPLFAGKQRDKQEKRKKEREDILTNTSRCLVLAVLQLLLQLWAEKKRKKVWHWDQSFPFDFFYLLLATRHFMYKLFHKKKKKKEKKLLPMFWIHSKAIERKLPHDFLCVSCTIVEKVNFGAWMKESGDRCGIAMRRTRSLRWNTIILEVYAYFVKTSKRVHTFVYSSCNCWSRVDDLDSSVTICKQKHMKSTPNLYYLTKKNWRTACEDKNSKLKYFREKRITWTMLTICLVCKHKLNHPTRKVPRLSVGSYQSTDVKVVLCVCNNLLLHLWRQIRILKERL